MRNDSRYVNGNPNWSGGVVTLDLQSHGSGYIMSIRIPVRDGSLISHEVTIDRTAVPESIALVELQKLGIEYYNFTHSIADGTHKFGRPFNVFYNGEFFRGESQ